MTDTQTDPFDSYLAARTGKPVEIVTASLDADDAEPQPVADAAPSADTQTHVNGASAGESVKPQLTRKRSPKTKDKDLDEYMKFARRMLKAAAKRMELEDPERLRELIALKDEVDAAIAHAAVALHEGENGFSWAQIAEPLGITRQAAQQRWGKK